MLCCRMDGSFLARVVTCHLVFMLVLGRLRYVKCCFNGDSVFYMLFCRSVRRLVLIVVLLYLGQLMLVPNMVERVLVDLKVVPS